MKRSVIVTICLGPKILFALDIKEKVLHRTLRAIALRHGKSTKVQNVGLRIFLRWFIYGSDLVVDNLF